MKNPPNPAHRTRVRDGLHRSRGHGRPRPARWARWRGVLVGALLAALLGCSGHRPPRPSVVAAEPERPLVFVPGILGSKLVDTATGRSLWGSGVDVLWPRNGGYDLALPLAADDPGTVRPAGVVDVVRLAFYRRPFYSILVDHLAARGYRPGDLADPGPDANLFLFDYDFRLDNREAVARLAGALGRLRDARGGGPLEFDLLCQSNGAYLCRALLRHGGRLAGEETSAGGPPAGLVPRRLALVGTANAGGLRVLRELRDGRRYVPTLGIGRRFRPEVIFSFRSVFLDLPHAREGRRTDLFVDGEGRSLEVDLYDAADWRRFGWSVWGPDALERLGRPRAERIFGDEQARYEYLRERLDEARDFQELLQLDPPGAPPDVELLMVQGRETATMARAVLVGGEDGWRTLFPGDDELAAAPVDLVESLSELGDGHATVTSQMALSALERSWMVGPPLHVEGTHFGLILDPEALRAVTSFFLDGSVAGTAADVTGGGAPP